MIDIFKEYISRNPSKVLGEITETTDKFGNPDIKIVGDFENIERIDVSDSVIPSKNKEVYAIESHHLLGLQKTKTSLKVNQRSLLEKRKAKAYLLRETTPKKFIQQKNQLNS